MQDDSQEKFNNIPSSISDHRTLVKPTGTDANIFHDASSMHFKLKTTSKTNVTEDVNQSAKQKLSLSLQRRERIPRIHPTALKIPN